MKYSKTVLSLLITFVCATAGPVWAAPQAVIDAVQAPAWVERAGRIEPATVGMEMTGTDRIRTGVDSRVYLKMMDGSTVKVGENGVLVLDSIGRKEGGVFTAALDVLKGAFRFTTNKVARPLSRDVKIRVAAVTVGIRGTDVWGITLPEKDLVCLLEGHVSLSHKDGDTRDMADAMTFYVAPRNAVPEGVAKVDPEKLKIWSAETDITPGAGAVRSGGKWKVLLANVTSEQDALSVYDKARNAGYAVTIRPHGRKDEAGLHYELLLAGLPDEAEAKALVARVKTNLDLNASVVK